MIGILLVLIFLLVFIILSHNKSSNMNNNEEKLNQNIEVEENNNKIDEEIYYTVNFDSDGGSNIDSVVVLKGECVKKPNNPVKEGYTFIEWQLDEKTYDFTTKLDKEITLKAKWQKKDIIEENQFNHSENNENSSSSNQRPANVLNLNNDIKVYVKQNTVLCGFAMFTTNLKEVFPHVYIKSGNYASYWPGDGHMDGELSEEELKEGWNLLKFDNKKEENAKNILSQYKKNKIEGIKDFDYSINNHRFEYSYHYISFANINYQSEAISVNKKIKDVFSSAIKFTGPCGDPLPQAILLTEELCDDYNLKCDRW